MNNEQLSNGKRSKTGSVLIYLGGILLVGSAAAKLAGVPPVVAQLGADGFAGARLTFIAILEIVSALLFLVPATRSVGLLLVSSYLGGAIATHVGHGQPIFPAAAVLSVLWLGVWLRHPEILWSLHREPSYTEESVTAKAVRGV